MWFLGSGAKVKCCIFGPGVQAQPLGFGARKWALSELVWGPKAEGSLAVCAGGWEGIGGCGGKQGVGRVCGPSLVASDPEVQEAGAHQTELSI